MKIVVRTLILFWFSTLHAQVDSTGRHPAATLDERLFLTINHWGNTSPGLDGPMQFLSNSITAFEVGTPAAMIGYGWLYHDRAAAKAGISTGLAEASSGIVVNLLKFVFRRDRPYLALQDVRTPGTAAGGYSMPSGHAGAAWALAGSLMFHYPKWQVIVPSAFYATAVSISRPYLGVHYPSDILVGGLLGVGAAYIFTRYEEPIMSVFQWALPQDTTKGTGILFLPHYEDGNVGLTLMRSF